MHGSILLLETPDKCEQFARNVEPRSPELAREARRRAVELRAAEYGADSPAELACVKAIYAYERTLFKKHGRRVRASYTWRAVAQKGIIPAVEATVLRKAETVGYRALVAEGMADLAFEAVVIEHPECFSPEALAQCKARVSEWQQGPSE